MKTNPVLSEEERRRRAADLPNIPGTPGYVAPVPKAVALAGAYQTGQQVGGAVVGALKEGYRTLLRPLENAVTNAGQTFDTAGQFTRGLVGANPAAAKPLSLVQNAEARTGATKGPPVIPPTNAKQPVNALAPTTSTVGKITQTGRSFSAPDDAGTVTLADARNAGKSGYGLSVAGMGLSPEATVAKLKDQTEQARQLNRMKETGLSELELAKVDARRAKDSEIFQLTQQGHSPTAASAFVAQRDAALAKQTAETPTQIAAGRQALATGEQTLQKGAMELEKGEEAAQTLQAKRAIAEKLGALDPADTKTRSALIDQLLAYDSKVRTPVKSLGYGAISDPTGQTPGVIYSKDTGQQQGAQGGGAAAQVAPPEAIAKLNQDPTLAQAFQAKYGYLPPGF